MNENERAAIIRAQKHGWVVLSVTEDCTLMARAFYVGKKHYLFVFPSGRITARTEAA